MLCCARLCFGSALLRSALLCFARLRCVCYSIIPQRALARFAHVSSWVAAGEVACVCTRRGMRDTDVVFGIDAAECIWVGTGIGVRDAEIGLLGHASQLTVQMGEAPVTVMVARASCALLSLASLGFASLGCALLRSAALCCVCYSIIPQTHADAQLRLVYGRNHRFPAHSGGRPGYPGSHGAHWPCAANRVCRSVCRGRLASGRPDVCHRVRRSIGAVRIPQGPR